MEVEGLTASQDKQQTSSNLRWLKQLSYTPTRYLQSAQKQTSPLRTQIILTHILTKRLLIYYVNVIGKFSQTVFGDSLGKPLIDLFTTSGFLSLRQKQRKIVSGHPSCVAKTKS